MGRFRRIMHASDFSPASRAAFARAIDLAKSNRAELTVVHVLTPVMPVAGGEPTSPRTWEEFEAATRAAGQRGLKTILARARKAGVRVKSFGPLSGGVPTFWSWVPTGAPGSRSSSWVASPLASSRRRRAPCSPSADDSRDGFARLPDFKGWGRTASLGRPDPNPDGGAVVVRRSKRT